MELSALSIGEKLSLKGKLFELSKKLTMMELESQNQEQCTFTPEINREFVLPDRESSFEANVQRAEMIKQQKQEMLKFTLSKITDAACTFTPTLSRKSSQLAKAEYVNKPVEVRLHEKAVEYQKNKQDLIERGKKYDANGRKLFSPTIPKPPTPSAAAAASSMSEPPKGTSITAGEFMYRDALDRNQRRKMRVIEARAEAERGSNSHMNNHNSVQILRKKADREVRAVFALLDEREAEVLVKADLQRGVVMLVERGKLPRDSLYMITEQAWGVLDPDLTNSVHFPRFHSTCVPFLMRETTTGSWSMDNSLPSPAVAAGLSDASMSFSQPPVSVVPKNEELATLRNVVQCLLALLKECPELLGGKQALLLPTSFRTKHNRAEEENKTPFSPVINKTSRVKAIANRKKIIEKAMDVAAASSGGVDGNESTATHLSSSGVSTSLTSSAAPSAVDVLELRSRLREEKLARLERELREKEVSECRFQPKLFKPMLSKKANRRRGAQGGDGEQHQASSENKEEDLPVYEKLYAYKDKQPRFRDEEELLEDAKNFKVPYVRKPEVDTECTFRPVVTPYVKPPPVPEEKMAAGYRESIERVRAYRAAIMTEPERRRLDMAANEQRYREGRKKMANAAPPTFLSAERKKAKEDKLLHPPARLFVDVRLSSNPHIKKVASIPIIDGDNPAIIADSFCKIYALDAPAKAILEEVVRQSMEVNGVLISDEGTEAGALANPLKLSSKRNVLRRSTGGSDGSSSGSSSGSDSGSSSSSSTSSTSDSEDSSSDSDGSSSSDDDDEAGIDGGKLK